MRLWNEGINQRSAVVSVLREVRDLSLCFQAFKFSSINPKCNRVAHTLAKPVTGDDSPVGHMLARLALRT